MGFRGRVSSYSRTSTGVQANQMQNNLGQDEDKLDVSCPDLCVGRVISALQLPDTQRHHVLQVDVGEGTHRTAVSERGQHLPLDQNRMAVALCNLKPAKVRGVLSQALIMCASSSEKSEILDPPGGAVPGDKVVYKGFPGKADKELKPKQRVWEQVQADLHTDNQCVASYRGAAFEVTGKGVC